MTDLCRKQVHSRSPVLHLCDTKEDQKLNQVSVGHIWLCWQPRFTYNVTVMITTHRNAHRQIPISLTKFPGIELFIPYSSLTTLTYNLLSGLSSVPWLVWTCRNMEQRTEIWAICWVIDEPASVAFIEKRGKNNLARKEPYLGSLQKSKTHITRKSVAQCSREECLH